MLALPLGGFLCTTVAGWPSIFYLFGGVGIIWCIFWIIFTTDSPSNHRFISQKERDYILDSTKETSGSHGEGESVKNKFFLNKIEAY